MRAAESRWQAVSGDLTEPAPERRLVANSPRPPRMYSRLAAVFLLLAAGTWLAATHPALSALSGAVLATVTLLVSLLAARSASVALKIYLVYMFVWFYLAPLLGILLPSVSPNLASSELGMVWLTVSVWLLGWTAGQLLVRQHLHRAPQTSSRLSARDAGSGLIAVGAVALLVEIVGAAGGGSA